MAEIVGTITNLSDFLSKTQVCLSVKPNDPQQQIFHRQGDANMRNRIIENAIDSVVNASNTSSDFKLAFRQYVKNKFDDNAKESDLKRILTLIEDDEEDIQV